MKVVQHCLVPAKEKKKKKNRNVSQRRILFRLKDKVGSSSI